MHPVIIVGIAALVAWLQQPEPQPAPAPAKVEAPRPVPDRVVLLPDASGQAGAVVLRSSSGIEQRLDKAYLGAEVARDGGVAVSQQEPAEIEARFRSLLDARPPAPVSFTVYFRSGGNDLTPESRAILDQVRAELGRRPAPEIQVIGHTDRVGRQEANDELSIRRAGTVRDILIAAGIPGDQIETAGRGERDPLVPTAEEVAEARNRRVEISVR